VIEPLELMRGVHLTATVFAVGGVGFLALMGTVPGRLAPAAMDTASVLRRRLSAIVWISLAAALVSGLGWLVLLGSAILEQPVATVLRDGDLWTVLTGTRFGQVLLVRAGLALALAAMLSWPPTVPLQLVAACAFAALPALTGHAGAALGPAGYLHLVSDIVHLVSACAWVGALPGLFMVLRTAIDPDFVLAMVRRFSLLGIASVVALTISGLINSWNLLTSLSDLYTTDYGRLLTTKIALFAIMVVFATTNRLVLTPRLPDLSARDAIRRNSMMEAALGVAVLLVVGVLGTIPPGGHKHVSPVPVSGSAAVTSPPMRLLPPGSALQEVPPASPAAEFAHRANSLKISRPGL